MKRVPIWMLGIATMLASCSQSDELLQTDASRNDEVRVTFSVQTPEMRTRADVLAETEESEAARYICEVYESDDASNLSDRVDRIEQTDADFSLLLKKNANYVFLLWADKGTAAEGTEAGNYYNAADLKNVQVAGAEADKCDEIAFYACQAVSVSSTGTIDNITLHHAVAKVCLYETNIIQEGSRLDVEYPQAQSFNVAEGTVTAAAANNSLTFFLENSVDGSGVTDSESGKSLGSRIAYFYVLAPQKGKSEGLSTMTFALTEAAATEGDPKTTQNTINNVPLQANYVTNIRGEFSDYTSATFNVSLTQQWEEGEDLIYPDVNMADFSGEDAFVSFIASLQGGTLKFSGNITDEHMAWLKKAFAGDYWESTLFVLDMSEATLVNSLPTEAFRENYMIEGLILPNNLTAITNEKALMLLPNCKFIKFPASLESIGQGLLYDCGSLEEVYLDETKITVIPDQTFYRCDNLQKIVLGNVTEIGDLAFASNLKLKELDLSMCESVPTIDITSFTYISNEVKQSIIVYVKNEDLQAAFQTSSWVTDARLLPEQFVVKP